VLVPPASLFGSFAACDHRGRAAFRGAAEGKAFSTVAFTAWPFKTGGSKRTSFGHPKYDLCYVRQKKWAAQPLHLVGLPSVYFVPLSRYLTAKSSGAVHHAQ